MKIESYSPTIRRKEMDAVLTAMVAERVGPGEQAQRLYQVAKEALEFDYGLSLRSPVTALTLALKSLDLADGAGVLVSALSPAYYFDVLADLRLTAVCADVDEASGALTPQTVQAAMTPEVRVVVVHHALGIAPDVPAIAELGIPIIEDISRSVGTNWGEKRVGSFGVFTILGLEERDLLTAGGGALLYACSRRDATVLRRWAELPTEFKLPDLNAALAAVQFKEAERNFEKRKEIAAIYTQAALRIRHKRPMQPGECEYNNYSFPIILETGMKDVKAYASKKDVDLECAFDDALCVKHPEVASGCAAAASLALRTVLFPLYPRLGKTQVSKISKIITTLP